MKGFGRKLSAAVQRAYRVGKGAFSWHEVWKTGLLVSGNIVGSVGLVVGVLGFLLAKDEYRKQLEWVGEYNNVGLSWPAWMGIWVVVSSVSAVLWVGTTHLFWQRHPKAAACFTVAVLGFLGYIVDGH